MAHILHGLEIGGVHFRIVRDDCWITIEQRDKDGLGDPKWDVVQRWNFNSRTHPRDGLTDRPLAVMLLTIVQQHDRLESQREDMSKSYTYSKTPEADPIEGPD